MRSFAPSTAVASASATSSVARSRRSVRRTARSRRRLVGAYRPWSSRRRSRVSLAVSYRACVRSCRRPMELLSGRRTRKHGLSSGPHRAIYYRGCAIPSVAGPRGPDVLAGPSLDHVGSRVPLRRQALSSRPARTRPLVDALRCRSSTWKTLKGSRGWSLGLHRDVVVLVLGDLVLGAFRAGLEE